MYVHHVRFVMSIKYCNTPQLLFDTFILFISLVSYSYIGGINVQKYVYSTFEMIVLIFICIRYLNELSNEPGVLFIDITVMMCVKYKYYA